MQFDKLTISINYNIFDALQSCKFDYGKINTLFNFEPGEKCSRWDIRMHKNNNNNIPDQFPSFSYHLSGELKWQGGTVKARHE